MADGIPLAVVPVSIAHVEALLEGNDAFTDTGTDEDGGTNDEFFGCDGDDTANMGEGNDLAEIKGYVSD